MTSLQIAPSTAISALLLVISFTTFIFAYNKAIKSRVDKSDLDKLQSYVDQQDKALHHRVDECKEEGKDNGKKLDKIIEILLKQ